MDLDEWIFHTKKRKQIVVRMNFHPWNRVLEIENHSTTLKKTTFGCFLPILNKAHGVRVGGKLSHHSMNQHVKVTVDGWNPWPAIYETLKTWDILRINWCRISSINSMFVKAPVVLFLRLSPRFCLWKTTWQYLLFDNEQPWRTL